jgi:hypothetical protein
MRRKTPYCRHISVVAFFKLTDEKRPEMCGPDRTGKKRHIRLWRQDVAFRRRLRCLAALMMLWSVTAFPDRFCVGLIVFA